MTNSNGREGKSSRKNLRLIVVGVASVLAISCLCVFGILYFLFSGITLSKNNIDIINAIVTDNTDEETSKLIFPSGTEMIYGIVYVETDQPVPVTIRWHYLDGNILFHEDTRKIEKRGEWFISPPLERGQFAPGMYRFEVLLTGSPVKSIDFEIE